MKISLSTAWLLMSTMSIVSAATSFSRGLGPSIFGVRGGGLFGGKGGGEDAATVEK